jgi:glycosyltransferase involved in cell wall biosynthesis
MNPAPDVTVVIPNYNSGPLLRLCLASLRRTPAIRIVVVDNGSSDASREAAEAAERRGLVELLRRDGIVNDGAPAHGAALDAGLARVETPLVFTLDSDAFVRRQEWLERYRAALDSKGAAVAGATKMEDGPRLLRRAVAWLSGRPIETRPEYAYVRPCHALYRTAVLKENALSFAPASGPDGVPRTTGENLFHRLRELGHEAAILPQREVASLVGHVRHASFVLNPERFPRLRERARRRGVARIERLLASREARAILEGVEF